MTPTQIDDLGRENANQLVKMDNNAAGMVKSLLLDLRVNKTFIKLSAPESHRVAYEFVEGTAAFVAECGADLGLTVTATTIEVPK